MTLPRWWNNRLKFGLALAFLALNVGLYLAVFGLDRLPPEWQWFATAYPFIYLSIALVPMLIRARSPRPPPPPVAPAPRWRETIAHLAQMPWWKQAIGLAYCALLLYLLWAVGFLLLHPGTPSDVSSLNNLRFWTALASLRSLDWALTTAQGLGWWGRWSAGGSR